MHACTYQHIHSHTVSCIVDHFEALKFLLHILICRFSLKVITWPTMILRSGQPLISPSLSFHFPVPPFVKCGPFLTFDGDLLPLKVVQVA